MIRRAGSARFVAALPACLALAGCNAALGIKEPIETASGAGGASGASMEGGKAGTTGGPGGSAGSVSRDGAPGVGAHFEWAQWPMPNPKAEGLPNSQSYDTLSFTDVVLDRITELQWQQSVDEGSYAWEDAASYCAGLTLAGGGWRLPTRIELLSLVDHTNANPVIDVNAFPNTPADYFWTASAFAGEPKNAWIVNFQFSDGFVDKSDTTKTHRVRCVR